MRDSRSAASVTDAAGAMHVALAGLGQPQLPGRAMKQWRADPRLQLRDALGDHRRRDAEFSRGRGEAGGVGGREERLKVYQDVHLRPFAIRER
ncbi:hypothetical protein ACVWZV_002257 [Bradyrhizobium sp. GM5.1]